MSDPSDVIQTRSSRSAADYVTLTPVEHVLRKPGMYVGSTVVGMHERDVVRESRVVREEVRTSEALERIFIEVVSNAFDNIIATRHMAQDTPSRKAMLRATRVHPPVDVTVDGKWVTVRNGGEPIPVELREDGEYVPRMIFGRLLTSSNYDEAVDRVGAGTNGMGVKLANIFSDEFEVRVGDPTRGHEYVGRWRRNMSEVVEDAAVPGYKLKKGVMTPCRGKRYSGRAYVEVRYALDWARFAPLEGYDAGLVALFERICTDYSFATKTVVRFNGRVIDARHPREYATVCFGPEAAAKMVVHYEWRTARDAKEAAEHRGRDAVSKWLASGEEGVPTPRVELLCVDVPGGNASQFGFVNGLPVPEGVHVVEAAVRVAEAVISAAPEAVTAQKRGGGALKFTASDVKGYIGLVVNCHLSNPDFTSQTKQVLTKPRPGIHVAPEQFRQALASSGGARWAIGERLAEVADAKLARALKRTDGGSRRSRVVIKGASDANLAGTAKSEQCTLWVTEGLSAANYVDKRIDLMPGKRDLAGVFPLRGKFINVAACSTGALLKNAEYTHLKEIMGLAEGADYSGGARLRYGRIVICADADQDGAHIRSLLLNCIAMRWPSLLAGGRVAFLATAVVKVFGPDGKVRERFFSDAAFDAWAASVRRMPSGWRVKRYKGMGSSTDADVRDDLEHASVVRIVFDEGARDSIALAFGKGRANDRKDWIEEYRYSTGVSDVDVLPCDVSGAGGASRVAERSVSSLIRHDQAAYCVYSLFRAIGNNQDQLKRSQRQALWHCLRHWRFESGGVAVKVARLASGIAEAVNYDHGEVSMQETVVKLAQSFTGANNLPVLADEGQFGSRATGPSGASGARYISTRLAWSAPLIFSEEAVSLAPRRRAEDEDVEPEWLPCDVPLGVINGCRGIATGWNTFIPAHNPVDVVDWLVAYIEGNTKPPPIEPWYRGFSGTVEISEAPVSAVEQLDCDAASEPADDGLAKRSLVTRGAFRVLGSRGTAHDVEVSELPVGLWSNKYKEWLESLIVAGALADFDDQCESNAPRFVLRGFVPSAVPRSGGGRSAGVTHATLMLNKSYGMNNMVLIDHAGRVVCYPVVEGVMAMHSVAMLNIYEKVKDARVAAKKAELCEANAREELIRAVIEGRLCIFEAGKAARPRAAVLADVKRLGLSEQQYRRTHADDFVLEEAEAAAETCRRLNREIAVAERTSAAAIWLNRLKIFRARLLAEGYPQSRRSR